MATLLQQLAAAQTQATLRPRQRGVVVYSPGRAVPGQQPQAAVQQAFAQRPVGARPARSASTARGDALAHAEQAFLNSPEARKQRQEAMQKQAEAAQPDEPWWKQGLGMILNNPITKTALVPIGALGTGRRLIEYGIEKFAEASQDKPWLKAAVLPTGLGIGLDVLASQVDTERTSKDPRSFVDKVLNPTSDYGYGQMLDQSNNEWVNRLAGLYGDVLTDPLTYMTAGGGKLTEGGGEVALHGGRAERIAELSKLADRPEAVAQLEPDILRAGQRGLNTASPALREELGLTAPRLRMGGIPIAGTERIAQPIADVTGALRAGLQKVPGVGALSRGPAGLEEAIGTLTKGTGEMSTERALTQVKLNNLMRVAAGETKSRGNRLLYQLVKENFKGKKEGAIRGLMTEAEKGGSRNAINDFFGNIAKVYEETSGQAVDPFLRDPETYVPHMLAPGFRRLLKEKVAAGDETAKQFMQKAGFQADDLLEGSGFIEKARTLTPNIDPVTKVHTPVDFTIGGKTLTLKEGNLNELNAGLRKIFPGFKGNFYETDPVRIGEAYISSLAKGAGSRSALNTLADTGSQLVERIGGTEGRGPQLGQALEDVNAAHAAQQPIADVIKSTGPYEAGVTEIPKVPAAPDIPTDVGGLKIEDFFKPEVNRQATAEQQQFFRNQGKEFAHAGAQDVRETQGRAAKDLYDLRKNYSEGLAANVKDVKPKIKVLDGHIDTLEKRLTELGLHRQETHNELTAFVIGIRKDISDLEDQIGAKSRYWKGRMTTARREAEAEMAKRYQRLRQLEARAQNVAEKAPGKLNYELRRRVEAATAPVRNAKRKIEEITAAVPGRPSDERLATAEAALAGREQTITDPLSAARDEYRNLLSKEGKRTAKENQRLGELQTELSTARTNVAPPVTTQTAFDKDTQRLIEINDALPNAANDAEKAALNKEKRMLQRRFQQGGKHSAEKQARQTMAEYEAWKKKVEIATRTARTEHRQASARSQLAVEDINRQLDVEGTIKATQQRATAARSRSEKFAARMEAPVDLQRDIQMVAPTRRQGMEAIEPLQRQAQVARDLHDEVLQTTREDLRATDEAMAASREQVLRDTQAKTPLVKQRDEAQGLLKQLEGTKKNLRLGGKGKVQYKEAELIPTLDSIEQVAKANPNLSDDALTATESVLQGHRRDLERVQKNDITIKQAQALVDKSFKEGKEGLAPVLTAALADGWQGLHEGLPHLGDVIVDSELYRNFTNLYQLSKEPKWFGRTFNALTNLFKTYATLTPGFHVRNALSGIFMNTADGVALKAQFEGAKYWQQFMKHGDEAFKSWPADIQEAFRAASGSGAGGQFAEKGVAAPSENRLYNFLSNNRVTRSNILGKRGGERVEGALRMGMAIDTIRKGGSVEDALTRITRVHFDYSQVSKLDEQMKRIIPFWTFMSRNLPLQVTEMWTKPKVYAIYQSAVRNLGTTPGAFTPQYWLDAGAVNTGVNVPDIGDRQAGGPLYFAPDIGVTRLQQDLSNIAKAGQGDFGGVVSSGNPLITAPLEFATGHDFYTGQNYGPNDVVNADPITTTLGRIFGQTNEAGQVTQKWQNMLRSLNPVLDRSIRLAPNVAGGTERDKSRQLESYARMLGAPIRVLTPQAQDSEYWRRYYKQQDEIDRVKQMMQLLAQKQAG